MGSSSSKLVKLSARKRAEVLGLKGYPHESLQPNLSHIAALIKSGKAKKILVLIGAGASVSAGIPDFRSPKTGLYHNLAKYNLPTAESVFDIRFFGFNPRPFFSLTKELLPGSFDPTLVHWFLLLLHSKQRLLRCVTQNIDTLESVAGLPSDKLIEAHGSFRTSTCRNTDCKRTYSLEWLRAQILGRDDAFSAGAAAEKTKKEFDPKKVVLPKCESCGSIVKPDIVFFGEDLPSRFYTNIGPDCDNADLLIVIGTSLQVFPVAGIPSLVGPHVPRLLINREAVGEDDGYDSDATSFGLPAEDNEEVAVANEDRKKNKTKKEGSRRGHRHARPAHDDDDDEDEDAHEAAFERDAAARRSTRAQEALDAEEEPLDEDGAGGGHARDDEEGDVDDDDDEYDIGGGRVMKPKSGGFLFGRKGNYRDVLASGDADEVVLQLARMLGWEDELKDLQKRELERIRRERAAELSSPASSSASVVVASASSSSSSVPAVALTAAPSTAASAAPPLPPSAASIIPSAPTTAVVAIAKESDEKGEAERRLMMAEGDYDKLVDAAGLSVLEQAMLDLEFGESNQSSEGGNGDASGGAGSGAGAANATSSSAAAQGSPLPQPLDRVAKVAEELGYGQHDDEDEEQSGGGAAASSKKKQKP